MAFLKAEATYDSTLSPRPWGGSSLALVGAAALCVALEASVSAAEPSAQIRQLPSCLCPWLHGWRAAGDRHTTAGWTRPLVFGIIFGFGGKLCVTGKKEADSFDQWEELLLLLVPPFVPCWGFFSLLHCYAADCCDCVTTYGLFICFSAWFTHPKCQQRHKKL